MTLHSNRVYRAVTPLRTHFRRATCEEAKCPNYYNGFLMRIDKNLPLGTAQARYLRQESGRSFREERQPDGLTYFIFPPGQQCFIQHRLPNDRPAFALVGGPGIRDLSVEQMAQQSWYGDDWIEDNKEHLDRIEQLRNRG